MKNQLITVNEEIYMNSRDVAEMIGKRHDHLIRDIDKYVSVLTNPDLGALNGEDENIIPNDFFVKSTYTDAKGEVRPCYLLTRMGCEFIANKLTGTKGVLFTAKYVKQFNAMQAQLQKLTIEREVARQLGKQMRRTMTDAIKDYLPESPTKKWAYSGYTDMVYKVLFGKTAKQLKAKYHTKSIRDCLSKEDLEKLREAEHITEVLIQLGNTEAQIKEQLNKKFNKMIA